MEDKLDIKVKINFAGPQGSVGGVRKSAKRQERFAEIGELYDEAKETIKRLHGVRWLSRGQVLVAIISNINTIADLPPFRPPRPG